MTFIKLNNINKYYGNLKVLNNLSLSINEGSIYGLLGPNGAGKTTTIRVLNGIVKKDSGEIFLNDKEITNQDEKQINKISGVLTENAGNYETLTAIENLIFFGKLYELDEQTILTRGLKLMEDLEIIHAKNQKVKTFSTGMKKRLNLVRALLPDPEILFLDEPTSGLDPETSELVNKLIKNLAKHGKTIVLCTHQLKYAEEICTHYGFIKNGTVIASGTYEELLKKYDDSLYLKLKLSRYPTWLLMNAKIESEEVIVKVKSIEENAEIIKRLVQEEIKVYEAKTFKRSLTDLYFNIVEGGVTNETFHESND